MKEIYHIKGTQKESFFGEHKPIEKEVTTKELIELLSDPKTIVFEARRKDIKEM